MDYDHLYICLLENLLIKKRGITAVPVDIWMVDAEVEQDFSVVVEIRTFVLNVNPSFFDSEVNDDHFEDVIVRTTILLVIVDIWIHEVAQNSSVPVVIETFALNLKSKMISGIC